MRSINAPIDKALATFRFHWAPPFSPRKFHQVLGKFVAHIHACFGDHSGMPLALATG